MKRSVLMMAGALVTETNRAGSLPEPLKCWWLVLSGIAKIAPAFHSNETFTPASFHTVDAKGRYDAYSMFVIGFQNIPILVSYLVAVTLLSFHLAHGASSWLQSLGWRHPKYDAVLTKLGPVLGATLALGYAAPPLAVLFKIIQL